MHAPDIGTLVDWLGEASVVVAHDCASDRVAICNQYNELWIVGVDFRGQPERHGFRYALGGLPVFERSILKKAMRCLAVQAQQERVFRERRGDDS